MKNIYPKLINGIAFFSMLTGSFGMLFSLIFLVSASIEDLIAAGFTFLAGAILFGTGLITLGIYNKSNI